MSQSEVAGSRGTREDIGQLMTEYWRIIREPHESFQGFMNSALTLGATSLYRGIQGQRLLPGNLQTLQFAREMVLSGGANGEEVDYSSRVRVGRGDRLLGRKVQQEYLLPVAALAPPLDDQGQPRVTLRTFRGQLGHILDVTGGESPVEVRVAANSYFRGLGLGIDIMHPAGPDSPPFVTAENATTMLDLGNAAAADMARAWSAIEEASLPVAESRSLISAYWKELA